MGFESKLDPDTVVQLVLKYSLQPSDIFRLAWLLTLPSAAGLLAYMSWIAFSGQG
ncbi:hypothetical protein BDQ17DRAFT_1353210 [Cyathus striatus]|nr:hypothetical protein BDQ17DRAFT_1353210 [Cyathus striatus]